MLKSLNEFSLQAIERISFSNDWMTMVFVLLLFILFLIKLTDATRLEQVIFTLFNVSFLERQSDENYRIIDVFQSLFFIFSIIVNAILVFEIKNFYSNNNSNNFDDFFQIFVLISGYLFIKKILEHLLVLLFMLKRKLSFFILSKANYFFAISIYIYASILLKEYANLDPLITYFFAGFLFLVRFIFYFLNNKNLILNQLFYFILYICALEIAPLLILIKLMF